MRLQSIRRYLSPVLEPLLLYVGLIYIIYWANTSSEYPWIRIAAMTVYTVLPLFIIRILHREGLTPRLGLKRGLPLIGMYYCVVSVAVIAVSAALINCYPNVLPNQLYGLVLGPIVEEIFFRGYILASVSKLGKYVAVGVSAFLFGAAHYMVAPLAFQVAVYYFIAGLILGCAFLYFGSILVPIIYHQAANVLFSGFYPPYAFPWNFVGYLLYFAPINAVLVSVYEFRKKAAPPSCWICGRTESDIRRRFPYIKDVLENYPVEGGTVKICFVCRGLHLTASDKLGKE